MSGVRPPASGARWAIGVLALAGLSLLVSRPWEADRVDATQTLLLTGFGPFDGFESNPSWEAASAFDGRTIRRTHVRVARLDVVYARATAQLRNALRETAPDLVVCLGVAAGDQIRLETVARNRDTSIAPDNEGVVHAGHVIREEGPALLPTRIPVRRIRERLAAAGYQVRTSDDAGGYLCNHVFYALLHDLDESRRAGFVHVPSLGDAWSLRRLRGAVHVMIEELDAPRE